MLTFTIYGPPEISGLSGNQIRVDRAFDAATAFAFEITNEDAIRSGDLTTNGRSKETSQQTQTLPLDQGRVQ